MVAEPASIDVKGLDGSSKGSDTMALKVASEDKAKGLVHRYLVTVRQNARQVRPMCQTYSRSVPHACVSRTKEEDMCIGRGTVLIDIFALRQGTASTKTRSEVAGGGRKPIKQKGTGNARQGSTRTPLRPGGGVIFGPKVFFLLDLLLCNHWKHGKQSA